jgi:ATP-dependent protease HslVU (ClpYQ) peptidase subunit
LPARDVVDRALAIAGEICIYTNANHVIEEL